MFTKDEQTLEKFIDYHVLIPDLDVEKWQTYFYKIVNTVLASLASRIDDSDIRSLSEMSFEFNGKIRHILPTPRLIKSFGRHLREKLNSPAVTVNIIDLMCLTVIQTANPRLYSWISNNRDLLIDHASNVIRVTAKLERKDSDKEHADEVKKHLENTGFCSEHEIDLVKFIFFRPDQIMSTDHIAKDKISRRRVSENQFFCNYFYRDTLPEIATPSGEQALISQLQSAKIPVEEMTKKLKDALEKEERGDIRTLIITTIEELIMSIEDIEAAYKLLVTYGCLAKVFSDKKEIRLLTEREYARFIVWRFIKRIENTDKVCEILIKLLQEPISDDFHASIVFYSMHPERNQYIQLNKECIDKIKKTFNENCEKRLYKDRIPLNIFLPEISDSPWELLFIWTDSQSKKNTENYLESLFDKDPDTIKNFLKYFLPNEVFGYEEKRKGLTALISIEKLKSILKQEKIKSSISEEKGLTELVEMIMKDE
ncbi:MAG: hypothetical protein Q7T53_03905 [Deltaproteobacteria bacterium]|nr:hypothetical protein [Deltaproteobacteria bacterium]